MVLQRGAEATLQVSQSHKQLTNSDPLHGTSNTQSSTSSPEAIEDGERRALTGTEYSSIVVNDLNHGKVKDDGGRGALTGTEYSSIVVNDLNHGKIKDASYNNASKLKKTTHMEKGEDVEEDPTLDEYHNMKGKKEDDDSTPKPTNESTRVDHFANLLVHVELEQLYKTLEFNQK